MPFPYAFYVDTHMRLLYSFFSSEAISETKLRRKTMLNLK